MSFSIPWIWARPHPCFVGKSLDLLEFWLPHFQARDSGTHSPVAENTKWSMDKQRSALCPLNLQSLCSCVQQNSPFSPETSTLVIVGGKGSLDTWSLSEVILKTWTRKPLPHLPVDCLKSFLQLYCPLNIPM